MCTIIMTAVLLTLNCPTPVASSAQAAAILAQAPGLSNRTNIWTLATDERKSVVFVPVSASAPKPIEPRRLDGTPLSSPPWHSIPYPYSPLSWAILHGGR